MVGHQALRFTDQSHQFPDSVITVGKFGQQPPPQRMSTQPDEHWGNSLRQTHSSKIHQTNLMDYRRVRTS